MHAISIIWTEVVTRPLTNGLMFLSAISGHQFWLAIILFTVIARLALYPLTVKQLRSMKSMQAMQPRMKAVQEKYKNDRQRQQKEMMALYKEHGVSPLGCLGPMFLQMPIFFGLFTALRTALADTPEGLVTLSQRLYGWLPLVDKSVPIHENFLWLNLGHPDPTPILPVLVGATMYVSQKMSQTNIPGSDPKQQSMNNMMAWMLPLMFGLWTFAFPSGVAIYYILFNLVQIVQQYQVTGWGGLARQPAPIP
ncbi:MAG: membrane protein insertase YidC, partial [Chloroflexi bacterium]|nr:membrane protein insertase YidC [Chloroflexota bacterium]